MLVSRSVCFLKRLVLHADLMQAQLESLDLCRAGPSFRPLQGLSTFASVHSALQTRYKNDLRNSQNPHNLVSVCQRVLVDVQL